jgi:hypothetical protein
MLYLQHDFYNIIFKIKHKLYIASGSASVVDQAVDGRASDTATTEAGLKDIKVIRTKLTLNRFQ